MPKFIKATLILAAGVCLGLPAGYFLNGVKSRLPESRGHELQLSFNRDYFENLPEVKDGSGERRLPVGTFFFDTDGDGQADPSSALTVPLVGLDGGAPKSRNVAALSE